MVNVIATSPTRVDMMGGTLDLWPVHHLLAKKATLNFGIDLFSKVTISERGDRQFNVKSLDQNIMIEGSFQDVCMTSGLPLFGLVLDAFWGRALPGLDVCLSAKSPQGAGLGGSSSLALSLAGGLAKLRSLIGAAPEPSERHLVRAVQNIESRLIAMPAGCQDHWGAMRGQVTLLTYPFEGVKVETFAARDFPVVNEELILVNSGQSRFSGMNNWDLYKKIFDGNRDILERFTAIGVIASDARDCLIEKSWSKLLELAHQDWQVRKHLCPEIETAKTQAIDVAACDAGAYFTRVCGAGGGGVMAVFAPIEKREAVVASVEKVGGEVLQASLATCGLKVVEA